MARTGAFLFLAFGILSTSAIGYELPGKQFVSKIIDKASKCKLPTIHWTGNVENEQNVILLGVPIYEGGSIIIISSVYRMFVLWWLVWSIDA